LRRTLERCRFTVFEFEWWHFDYSDWRKYPNMNIPFDKLHAASP
jgi:D-alanyl-D-alanine dipeptidase